MLSAGISRAATRTKRFAIAAFLSLFLGSTIAGGGSLAAHAVTAAPPSTATPSDVEYPDWCMNEFDPITVELQYRLNGELLMYQCFSTDLGQPLDVQALMTPPEGYGVAPEWSVDDLVVDWLSWGQYENDVPVVRLAYGVTIEYMHGTNKVYQQQLTSIEHGSSITEADLNIPTGFKLVAPFPPHTVTANATMPVQVVPEQYQVTINYTENGNIIATEVFDTFPFGDIITVDDLTIPAGYELAIEFADVTVTGPLVIDVALKQTVTEPGIDPTPTPAPKPDGNSTTPPPADKLAATGGSTTLPLAATGLALTAAGILALATIRRRAKHT